MSVLIGRSPRYLLDIECYPRDIVASTGRSGTKARPRIGYQHFCPAARALEVVGEKWSLLVVRDLLAGPRRFSDLRRSLTAITPKWLSARLRALEADGVVEREATGQREVWYRLTPKGHALEHVIDALLVWGLDYAVGPPRPGEAVHPGRAIDGITRYLQRRGVRPTSPVAWVLRFAGDRTYTVRFDGERWSRHRGETAADIVIETSPQAWVRFLAADRDARRRWLRTARVKGTRKRIEELVSAFGPRPAATS
jgi:DNA-binding HxlR family transcriptional regulator